jgi:hypothetical protein
MNEPLSHSNSDLRGNTRRQPSWPLTALVVAGVLGLVISIILPWINDYRERHSGGMVKCASNMTQIGLGAIMYATKHGGRFPPDFETLIKDEDLSPQQFICPATGITSPTGPTTQSVFAALKAAGTISYI